MKKKKQRKKTKAKKRTQHIKQQTVDNRIQRDKTLVLEKLQTTPIVEVVCKKVGIGTTTYYRWRQDDPEFLEASNQALRVGKDFISAMAESNVIKGIRDEDKTYTIYWLKNHHVDYSPKLQKHDHKHVHKADIELLDDEKQELEQSLVHAGISSQMKNEQ
jgi:hypothetical protein